MSSSKKLTPRKVLITFLRALLLAVVTSAALYYIPTPYVLRAPGRTTPAGPMVQIRNEKTYPTTGELLIATVFIERANALTCLYSMLEPASELVPLNDYSRVEERSDDGADLGMAISHYTSQVAALRYLGYKLENEPVGVRILQVLPDTPAEGVLRRGDLVTAVNGGPIKTMEELQRSVRGSLGPIKLQVRRGLEQLDLELTPENRAIGVQGQTTVAPGNLPVSIEIDSGGIAGSSAGLCFSLEIIDRLTPDDLTRGRLVAATGTIDPNGKVLSITGARFKAVAASRAGVSIFLCPREDADEARAAGTGLTIVPVSTLEEAIQALRD